jgi:hypothetical protein
MKDNFDTLIEWAVWGNLHSKSDPELIFIKGHILIDYVLFISLDRLGIQDCKSFSFFSKVKAFQKVRSNDDDNKKTILDSLYSLNILRNKLAHDVGFKLQNEEFENWSKEIILNLEGMKYTKFTRRTRIVHSFSFLAKAILDLSN